MMMIVLFQVILGVGLLLKHLVADIWFGFETQHSTQAQNDRKYTKYLL